MLHDTHCISCHDTQVYKRDSKVATNYDEIRTQVVRWQTNVSLHWSEADIDAVTTYLARTVLQGALSGLLGEYLVVATDTDSHRFIRAADHKRH